MQKIPLLIFVNTFERGGSERQAVELIKGVDRSRFDIAVACFQRDGPLVHELPRDLIAFESFPLTSFRNWSTCRQAARFIALLRRTGVKVVQCFDFYSNVFAIPLARVAAVPVIVGSRRDEASMRTLAQRRAERISYRLASAIVANALAIKDQLVTQAFINENKVHVIYNGVDLRRFETEDQSLGDRSDSLKIAVLANLRPEKGHFIFLEAVQRLVAMGVRAKFVIAGNGVMREAIERKIDELSLLKDVSLTGEIENVPAFLRGVDILVLPSLKNEGFPNAVMEAMAAGKPVVATGTGGVPELVIHGLTGYLVPPGDSQALAEPLSHLCRESELRRKMGEAGRHRVISHFTIERMAQQFEDLYIKLLGNEANFTSVNPRTISI